MKTDQCQSSIYATKPDPAIRPDAAIEQLLLRHRKQLAERDHEANKGTYGRLTLVAGSRGMAGAAFLLGLAAFRCGIGMVKYLGPECNRVILQELLPEAMYDVLPGEMDSSSSGMPADDSLPGALAERLSWGDYMVIGPGLSKSEEARQLIRGIFDPEIKAVLQKKKLVVLDADALNLMAEEGLDPGVLCACSAAAGTIAGGGTAKISSDSAAGAAFSKAVPVVITPHVVEMSRLTGIPAAKIKEDPVAVAESYARTHGVYVVLKDARTVAASPDPAFSAMLIDSGCGAMAKAGSGDVLCGFIAGFTAMLFGDVKDALPLAVWAHGASGCVAAERMGCHSILARDIAEAAGEMLKRTLRQFETVRGYEFSPR